MQTSASTTYFNYRENYFKWWIKVEGLNHTEIRHLAEKIGEQPEHQAETDKLAEFSVPSWLVSESLMEKDTILILFTIFLKKSLVFLCTLLHIQADMMQTLNVNICLVGRTAEK